MSRLIALFALFALSSAQSINATLNQSDYCYVVVKTEVTLQTPPVSTTFYSLWTNSGDTPSSYTYTLAGTQPNPFRACSSFKCGEIPSCRDKTNREWMIGGSSVLAGLTALTISFAYCCDWCGCRRAAYYRQQEADAKKLALRRAADFSSPKLTPIPIIVK